MKRLMGIRKEGALQSQMQEKGPSGKAIWAVFERNIKPFDSELKTRNGRRREKKKKRLLDKKKTGGIEALRDVMALGQLDKYRHEGNMHSNERRRPVY
jgi:hypothetical protein